MGKCKKGLGGTLQNADEQRSRISELEHRICELQENESRLCSLVENSSNLLFELAPDGRILYSSPSLKNILGYDPEFAHNKPVAFFIAEEDLKEADAALKKANNGKPIKDLCLKLKHKNSLFIDCEINAAPVLKNGKTELIHGTIQDISKRLDITRELIETEKRLKQAFNATQDGIWDWDLKTQNVECGASWFKMLGYEPHEFQMTYDFWEKSLHPEDRRETIQKLKDYLDGKASEYNTEFRFKTKSGKYKWILARASISEKDSEGKPLRMIGTHVDLDPLKTAERKLKENESRLSGILGAITADISMMDSESNIVWANDYMKNVYGHDILGKKCHHVYHGTDAPCSDCPVKRTFIDGKIHSKEKETLDINNNKRYIWATSNAAQYNKDGSVRYVVEVVFDITDLKNTEKALKEARKSAEDANMSKSEFLANMSHEIRTPMNGVLGNIQLLEETDLDREQKEYVDIIKVSGETLIQLINDILDISKIEAGKLSLSHETFNLKECVNSVLNCVKYEALRKNLKLEINIGSSLPEFFTGASNRIKQVLLNLLVNAIKFTPEGMISIEASLAKKLSPKECLVHFSVKDTGIGIAPEKQDKIFAPFTQADSSTTRKYGGTGLGLSISSRLTDLLGGRLQLESKPGKGSCFFFDIPLKISDKKEKQTETEKLAAFRFNLKTLAVEDNKINQKLISKMLTKLGCAVDLAENGATALEKFKNNDYDVIFMDIQMPEMDGYEATREIRKLENGLKRIPIIAKTAHAMESAMKKCLDAGMDGYITKPIKKAEVIAALENILRKSKQKEER